MKKQTNSIGIAMVYIGTLIGAGFASGQELFQFFGRYGVLGLAGIGLAGVLFSLIGYAVLRISNINKAAKVEEIVFPFKFKFIKMFISVFFGLFLFGIIVVMLAGSGAMVHERFAIKPWIGSGIMMILTLLTTLAGKHGIIKSFKIIVPFLIFGMLTVIILTLANVKWDDIVISSYKNSGLWIVSALLFVSCNMIAAVSVLVPLGKETSTNSTAAGGAVLAGVTLGGIGLLAVLSMIINIDEIAYTEVPLVYLISKVSDEIGNLYSLILFAGIYTTAVGCLFALEEKVQSSLQINPKVFNMCILATALLLSDVGFSKLIGIIYTLSGYIGLLILLGVTIKLLKRDC